MNLIKLAAFAVFSVGMSLSVYPMEISKARNYTREFPVGISSTKLTDMLKSSTASLAETDIIADPEGVMTVYSRSSIAIAPIGETAGETVDCGFAGIIVTGGNGDVYMKNPFSQFPTDTYIKGHVDGTKMTFDIPALNADGMLLDTEKLYYNIYINDAKFTLNPNDYLMLDEEITDIPYLFTDAHDGMLGDITIEGQKHTFILFDEGIEAVGVQSFYVDNGKTYYSPLVNNKVTGIDDAAIDNSPVVEETYTDLAGRSVTDPGHGLYIKTVRRADGNVESFKIVK